MDDHNLLEVRFAYLEVAQCYLMLDQKQLESDNQALSSNLALVTLDLRIVKERCKKTEDDRIASLKELDLAWKSKKSAEVEVSLLRMEKGLLLEQIRSLEVVELTSAQTITSLSFDLEKVHAELELLALT